MTKPLLRELFISRKKPFRGYSNAARIERRLDNGLAAETAHDIELVSNHGTCLPERSERGTTQQKYNLSLVVTHQRSKSCEKSEITDTTKQWQLEAKGPMLMSETRGIVSSALLRLDLAC